MEKMELSKAKFLKIEGIREVAKHKLPFSKTLFIFNWQKQKKDIDEFLKNRKYVSIRSDRKGYSDFCPHDLKCRVDKAEAFIKQLNFQGYAVILQEYIPWEKDIASGNILILKKHFIIELMGEGPLIWLNRDGKIEERIKIKKSDLKEVEHSGIRLVEKQPLVKVINLVKSLPAYKIIEFTIRPEGLYFWQIRTDSTAKEIESGSLTFGLDKFKKIKEIMIIKKYGLPMPKTIFIFDFDKQEKEIDEFIKNRDYVAIRTDRRGSPDFCPHNLRCPKSRAKRLIKELNLKGYAVILHEQKHIPFGKRENQVSGNILILKKHFLVELMEGEPLINLIRDGKVDEFIKIEKKSLRELANFGKRLIKKKDLDKILRMIKKVPNYKIIEFTARPEGLYFWQIIDDKTAKTLDFVV